MTTICFSIAKSEAECESGVQNIKRPVFSFPRLIQAARSSSLFFKAHFAFFTHELAHWQIPLINKPFHARRKFLQANTENVIKLWG
jgi:hypothetical protein